MIFRALLCAAATLSLAIGAAARDAYFDVPYVATPPAVVEAMLKLAETGPDDVVYDLGSGDGCIVIAAARDFKVKKGVGIDIDPELVSLATKKAKEAGVDTRVSFARGDIFKMDFSEASILTLYLLPEVNLTLRPRILDLKPGTRVVSHAFNMGDWVPDGAKTVDRRRIYLWVVPAKVQGTWTGEAGGTSYRLTLAQQYQQAKGQLTIGGRPPVTARAVIKSETVTFTAGGPVMFSGTVDGSTITGMLRTNGASTALTLTKQAD